MNIIRSVDLVSFRCHKKYHLDCNKLTTLIVGENGSGKTSVLEAIYIALQGKSFRNSDEDIKRRGDEYYKIDVALSDKSRVVVRYMDGKKSFEIDNKKYGRLPGANKYPVVLFEPDDLHLVGTSPARRRNYFDKLISQIDKNYHSSLIKYEKALRQRNELLKGGYMSSEQVFCWDVMLARYGSEIVKWRKKIIGEVNKKVGSVYKNIANNEDNVEIKYITECGVGEDKYLRGLGSSLERDNMVGHTTFGVHKDDYKFIFNGVLADGSASRGEVRSIILAMKFIEAEILEDILQKKPLILLDDIFSELDEYRQKHLVDNFKENQIIITSVAIPDVVEV